MRSLTFIVRAILPLALSSAGPFALASDRAEAASVEGVVNRVVQATGRVFVGEFSCVVDRQSAKAIAQARDLNADANVIAALRFVQSTGDTYFCEVANARLEKKQAPLVSSGVAASSVALGTGSTAGLGGSGISGLGGSGISGLGGSGISGLGGSGISGLGLGGGL